MLAFSVSFFITILNFAVLFFILKRFLWKPVRTMIEARAAKVRGELADAAIAKGVADDLKARFEERIAGAEGEADKIIKESAEQAVLDAKVILDGARAEAETIRLRAEASAAREKAASLEALTGEIARIATAAAAKLASREARQGDAAAAEALVRELGKSRV